MKRRELYKYIAELKTAAGGATHLLHASAAIMAELRGGPTASLPQDLRTKFQNLFPTLLQDDALGQIYQAVNAPAIEAAYRATTRERRKFAAAEIPAVTQLFTPKWVVQFLLQNTLGRLWRQMHPDTRLAFEWLEPTALPPIPPRRAIDLRICDPACGTMNFGLAAIDLLREFYREEIDRAGEEGWQNHSCLRPDEIDQSICAHNLYGFDIDPTAIDLARRALEIKITKPLRQDNLVVRDALAAHDLSENFDIVITNPPYLSARNLDPAIIKKLKRQFPSAWRDHYACFIVQSLRFLRQGGRAGILCMHSFMFTSAFERLRREILQIANLESLAHFGPGLFDIGNPGTLQTAAIVLHRDSANSPAVFHRAVDACDKQQSLRASIATFESSPSRFVVDQKIYP